MKERVLSALELPEDPAEHLTQLAGELDAGLHNVSGRLDSAIAATINEHGRFALSLGTPCHSTLRVRVSIHWSIPIAPRPNGCARANGCAAPLTLLSSHKYYPGSRDRTQTIWRGEHAAITEVPTCCEHVYCYMRHYHCG